MTRRAGNVWSKRNYVEVTPTRTKDAQSGGGSIVDEQPEPNTIVVTLGGAAVAGSDFHGPSAGMALGLGQDLEIIPTRPGARPPRVGMVARVVGTLQVTDPGKCGKACGPAGQGPATASLLSGPTSLLTVNVKPSGVACGQGSSLNQRDGPVETPAAAGRCRLAAVADFDSARSSTPSGPTR